MSTVNNGPQIVRNGLVLGLNSSARGSYLPNSLINMNNWTVSNGSVTGYNQNGDTAENQRSAASNPWGDTGIIWGTFPDGTSGADGGWNTPDFNIDNTKLYRFSVWVKRTSSTSGGTFYFGMYAGGDGSRRMDNSAVEGNAYWSCIGTSGLVQNVWHLYVGHVYPSSTSYTGRHPDTGYYFVNNPTKQGDVNGCNIGTGDLKWSSNSTTGIHRTYHYYCADSTTRLQFYNPRVDLVDGKQPSITELVTRSPIQWKDLSGNNNNGTLTNGPIFSAANGGCIVFDGVNDYVAGGNLGSFYSQGTISYWMYSTAVENYRNPFSTNYNGVNVGIRFEQYTSASPYGGFSVIIGNDAGTYTGFSYSPSAILTVNSWYNVVLVWNIVTNNVVGYLNGDLKFNSSHTYWATTLPAIAIGNGFSGDRYFKGNISSVEIYNRGLSATEVSQNYNAVKSRFGL